MPRPRGPGFPKDSQFVFRWKCPPPAGTGIALIRTSPDAPEQMPRPRFGRGTETGGKVHRTRANAPPAGTGRKSGLSAAGAAVSPHPSFGPRSGSGTRIVRRSRRLPHRAARALPGVIFAARGFLFIISEAGQNAKAEGRKRPPSAPGGKKTKRRCRRPPRPPDCRRGAGGLSPGAAAAEGRKPGGAGRSLSGRKKQGLDKQRKRGYSEFTPPRGRGVRRF